MSIHWWFLGENNWNKVKNDPKKKKKNEDDCKKDSLKWVIM